MVQLYRPQNNHNLRNNEIMDLITLRSYFAKNSSVMKEKISMLFVNNYVDTKENILASNMPRIKIQKQNQ